jgi:nucleoside-diphosphate-sugar epimerase
MPEPQTVLVTGAFGLVGTATVERLVADGHRVVATDLKTPAYVEAAKRLPVGVDVRWADLTQPTQVTELFAGVAPTAVIHLVGMIAPAIYRNADLGRRVNVDITDAVVTAAQNLPTPPRFVHASSVAVFGPRNPHRHPEPATARTPTVPNEVYGATKLEAEGVVRSSGLEWVILRLGGVVSTNLASLFTGWDVVLFESALPSDGRIHTVDLRDVAKAFAAAVTADAAGEVLLIGGDDTHRLRYDEAARDLMNAVGVAGVMPEGRRGDPDSEVDWFATDWMDTRRAQEALLFQEHSWPDILAEVREVVGRRRHLLWFLRPLARTVLERRSAYYRSPGEYADPWGVVRSRLGDPTPSRT